MVQFIASANVSFNIVENEEFNALFDYISSQRASVPARKTLMKDLVAQADAIKAEMIGIIEKTEYICTTADVLTSKGRSFLGLTMHYFDESLEKKSLMLAFRRLRGRHTHEALAEKILEIHREFNLKRSKITHIVTDGGSNFCKAFRRFGESESVESIDVEIVDDPVEDELELEIDIDEILGPEENDEEFIPEDLVSHVLSFDQQQTDENEYYDYDDFSVLPKQMRCLSHICNLIGSDDFEKELKSISERSFEKFETAYEKLKNFWTLCRRSTVAKEIVERICKRSFPYPNTTRWNSKFDCIETALDYKKNISESIDEINKEAIKNAKNRRAVKVLEKMLPNDWRYLADYANTLGPIATALDILQGEERACLGYILPTLFTVKESLERMMDNDTYISELGKEMNRAMLNCIERRFGSMMKISDENKDLVLAAVVHPNFKLSWIQEESDREYAQSLLINSYISLVHSKQSDVQTSQAVDPVPVGKQKSKESDFFKHLRLNERRTSTDEVLTMEIWKYISQPITDDGAIQMNQIRSMPFLEVLFRKYNTTLSSSAAVERLFSNATLIFTPQRNRISDEHFERALLVRRNKWLLKKKQTLSRLDK